MSVTEKRTKTLQLLVQASQGFSDPAIQAHVNDELSEILRCGNVMPLRRRRLFRIVHLARALESTLHALVKKHGATLPGGPPGMGAYLSALANPPLSLIPHQVRVDCQSRIANLRNRLVHGAGVYPTGDPQIDAAVYSAHACLTLLLR